MTTEEFNLENYIPKGELEGFPKEIIAKMLDYQKEQVDRRDVTVFENLTRACPDINGFSWNKTKEGYDFWEAVIEKRNFDLFFKKYPKQDNQDNSQEFNLENYVPKEQLTGFPKEIIALMLNYQEKQGNKRDVSVFEENRTSYCTGFVWNKTKEGHWFWDEVIREKNFNLFFKKYPKICSKCHQKYAQVGNNVILSDSTSTQSSVEINITEKYPKKEDSQLFRVGDKVYDIMCKSIGIVTNVNIDEPNYQLTVNLENGNNYTYTIDGRINHYYKTPQLLHYRDDYNYTTIDFKNLPKRQEKRWRAEVGEKYYYLDVYFDVHSFIEEYPNTGTKLYNSGNYFQTKEQAQEVADKLKEYLNKLNK